MAQVFSCELGQSFGSTFFEEHLNVTAFVLMKDLFNIFAFLSDSLKKSIQYCIV